MGSDPPTPPPLPQVPQPPQVSPPPPQPPYPPQAPYPLPPPPFCPPPAAGPAPLGYATNAAVFEGQLHPLTIVVSLARALQQLLPIVLVAVVFRAAGRTADTVELIIAGLGSLRVISAVITWATYRYYADGATLHIKSGVLFQSRRSIPLDRIQNINLKRDWIHQLLKLAEVQVETASGAGAEATLSSLSIPQAEALRRQLLETRQPAGAGGADASLIGGNDAAPAETVYQAGIGRLILAGATRNQAGAVFAAIIGFGFYVQDVAGWDVDRALVRRMARLLPDFLASWALAAVGILGLIVVGWVVSMARSVITYYGFRLDRQGGRLRRTYGLFTKRESVFPTHRLQLLRIEAPLIQRKLGLCRVTATTAGSFAEKEDAATSELCPIIERSRVGEVCGLVIEGFDLAGVPWRKVSPKTIRRTAFRYLLVVLIVTGLARLSTPYGWWMAAAAPLAVVGAVLRYRALRWSVTDELILVRHGVWTRQVAVVPRSKIQHTTLTATPFQHRMGLATLHVRTAGGGVGGSGVGIVDLPSGVARGVQDELAATRLAPASPR